jgi:succinyl-diaminopimelate desuccinylase
MSIKPSQNRKQQLETLREKIAADAHNERGMVVKIAKRLLAVPSVTPPGATTEIAGALSEILKAFEGIDVEIIRTADHIANVVAVVKGHSEGKRLVFNGHLDTFPLVDERSWSTSPWGDEVDGRLYGVGVSDMKGGVAAAVYALCILSRHRSALLGEVVGTFVGDEETLGALGTQYLLEKIACARGDAMISGDIGSSHILLCGEKGMIWLTVKVKGKSAHAAHVHKGDSAIERLIAVIQELATLRQTPVTSPKSVEETINRAAEISENYSGAGETEVLKSVTVTF